MPNMNVVIHGRNFSVSCAEGEQRRVTELANYVDRKTKIISSGGNGPVAENQVLMLTCLLLADEVKNPKSSGIDDETEQEILEKIKYLEEKIKNLKNI